MWVSALIDPYGTTARVVEAVGDDHLVAVARKGRVPIVTGDRDPLDADLDPPAMTRRRLLEGLSAS